MDFIERIFGLSPDGGSGLFELLLLMLTLVGLVALRRTRSRPSLPNHGEYPVWRTEIR